MARGSALPTSSEAIANKRRATYSGSPPAVIMRAYQYNAASGAEPRTDLCNAEIKS